VSLSLRLKDLLGPVTRVNKKKKKNWRVKRVVLNRYDFEKFLDKHPGGVTPHPLLLLLFYYSRA